MQTVKSEVNVVLLGKDNSRQRCVTAHVDTLGAIVRAIKPYGRLKLDQFGGFPWNMIEEENCLVHVAGTGQDHLGPSDFQPCLQRCRNRIQPFLRAYPYRFGCCDRAHGGCLSQEWIGGNQ